MDVFRLRLKIGVNEFEAEGSEEYVKSERQIFLESVAAEEVQDEEPEPEENLEKTPPAGGDNGGKAASSGSGTSPASADMAKLATQDKSDKDLIILTALPQAAETQKQDALLLLLLAHKVMRGVDNVKATDALNGTKQSGIQIDAISQVTDKIPQWVLKTGVRKGSKYRLSTPGVQKASAIAQTLLSHVA
jgi:hypothetical protein